MLDKNHEDQLREIWLQLIDIHKELYAMLDGYEPCSEEWDQIGMVSSSIRTAEDAVNCIAHITTRY